MSDKRLSGSIALTKLTHVMMEKKGKNGMVKGIFIPCDANMLIEGKISADGKIPYYMPINILVKEKQDDKGQNGFISKTIDSKAWKEMSDSEKEESKKLTPILGSIKDFSQSSGSYDTKGDAGDGKTFNADDDEDLPF
jgi:hypothetical protein